MSIMQLSNPPPHRVLDRWSIYLTFCVMGIALAVLAGWQWDIGVLRRPIPRLASMNPTTATAFLLASQSFFLLLHRGKVRHQQFIGRLLKTLVLLTSAVCLASHIAHSWPGDDPWLYRQQLTGGTIGS